MKAIDSVFEIVEWGDCMTVYDDMNAQTKKRIEETLLALLVEKDFSKISVRDITAAAGINRGTFYLHFVDKYALVEKMEQDVLAGLMDACSSLEPAQVLQEARNGELSLFSMQVFHYIDMHFNKFKVLLSRHNQSGFLKRLREFFCQQFIEKYEHHALMGKELDIPTNYFAAFAASAFLGVIEEWLNEEVPKAPEDIANYYVRIILSIQRYNEKEGTL